jgi:tetratricopeptide (TPR) repeat protein
VLAAGGAYLALRVAALGHLLPAPRAHLPAGDPLQHLLLVARSAAAYARLAVWPFGALSPIHHATLPVPRDDPAAWAALGLLAAAVVGLLLAVRRRPATGWPLAGAAAALVPVLNLAPLDLTGGAFVAERFLLLPLAVLAVAGATVPAWPPAGRTARAVRPAALLLGAGWLAAGAATLHATLPRWRDNGALWRWAVVQAPRSPTPYVNLALEQSREGDPPLALATAREAITLDPAGAMGWNNAGLALFALGRWGEAEAHFARAAELQPGHPLFWSNLGAVLLEQGRLAEAERVLAEEALRRSPAHPLALLNLGALHLQRDRPDRADPVLARALELVAPAQRARAQALLARARAPGVWLRLGDARLASGDAAGALQAFERAAALGAGAADAAVGRSAALLAAGDAAGAAAAAEAGLRAAPDDARLHVNAALAARRQGDRPRARRHLERAAALRPDWDLPRRGPAGTGEERGPPPAGNPGASAPGAAPAR